MCLTVLVDVIAVAAGVTMIGLRPDYGANETADAGAIAGSVIPGIGTERHSGGGGLDCVIGMRVRCAAP